MTFHDAVAVVRENDELNACVPTLLLPPGEHLGEFVVGALAGGSGAIVPNAEFVRGMVGFAVPEDGDVAESARDFVFEEKLRQKGVPVKVRELERHGRETLGDRTAFIFGDDRGEVVHAEIQVPRELRGFVMLQTGASRRIRAVDAKRASGAREAFAEARKREETFFAERLDRLHAGASEDRVFALFAAAEKGVRDDSVLVRASAREDRRMVHVGFGREGREVVRPLSVTVEKSAEHRHVNVGHAVGTKTVKAHDQKAGRSVVRVVRHVLPSLSLSRSSKERGENCGVVGIGRNRPRSRRKKVYAVYVGAQEKISKNPPRPKSFPDSPTGRHRARTGSLRQALDSSWSEARRSRAPEAAPGHDERLRTHRDSWLLSSAVFGQRFSGSSFCCT